MIEKLLIRKKPQTKALTPKKNIETKKNYIVNPTQEEDLSTTYLAKESTTLLVDLTSRQKEATNEEEFLNLVKVKLGVPKNNTSRTTPLH